MAEKNNLTIDQGSVFYADLVLKDENGDVLDLEGYQAVSQIRKWYTSNTAAATFGTSINTTSGAVALFMNQAQTASIPAGRYVYDVEITDGVETLRIMEGIVTVTPEVTR